MTSPGPDHQTSGLPIRPVQRSPGMLQGRTGATAWLGTVPAGLQIERSGNGADSFQSEACEAAGLRSGPWASLDGGPGPIG
ncbi:hypothetical protein CyaNS01_02679 [Cyanobium sp. NS01]|nr:hypothetical protein CyaNS01_02679 [Cyanobium sp. NS01]